MNPKKELLWGLWVITRFSNRRSGFRIGGFRCSGIRFIGFRVLDSKFAGQRL